MFHCGLKRVKLFIWIALFFSFNQRLVAGLPPGQIYHLAPSHWYTGFKDSFLEIILHAENSDLLEIKMEEYQGVEFLGKFNSANRHVAYLQLLIKFNAVPGTLHFSAKPSSRRIRYVKPFKFTYNLLAKSSSHPALAVTDIVYKCVLDKFFNGNTKNDRIQLKNPYDFNPEDANARHGGDLEGLKFGADYLKNLGITAIWLNPVQENDAPLQSNAGRNITNHYIVDPRYGNNEMLGAAFSDLQKNGIKICMDFMLNQTGQFHWMNLNFDTGWFHHPDSGLHTLPDFDFFNDPQLSATEKNWISNHWMDPAQPDINQKNKHMAVFLKQCCLWWTEYGGISAWILENPQFSDLAYNEYLIHSVQQEYPTIQFVSNTKTSNVIAQASYVKNNFQAEGQFQNIVDYQIFEAVSKIAATDTCDHKAWQEFYRVLSFQTLYKLPAQNLFIMDNYLCAGVMLSLNKNPDRWKMFYGLLYALPGTPVLISGVEQVTKEKLNNANCFQTTILSKCTQANCIKELQNSADYLLLKKYSTLRKNNPALLYGSFKMYAPADGIFSFVREYQNKKILVLLNDNRYSRVAYTERFQDILAGASGLKNLITGDKSLLGEFINLPAHGILFFEILR